MEMYKVGIWGYSFASIAYIIFSLLILAAHNQSSIAKWVLFSALMASMANMIGVLQITLGFSLQWAMLVDAIKIATFSVLILSFNIEKGSVQEIFKNKRVSKYLLFWLGAILVCWGISYSLDYAYEYLFLLFVSTVSFSNKVVVSVVKGCGILLISLPFISPSLKNEASKNA